MSNHGSMAATVEAVGPGERVALTASTYPGFLSPEETVPWRPPEVLIRRLADGLTARDDHRAFAAANRLALEAFRGGERQLAARVCWLEIDYASAKLRTGAGLEIALLGLQPVINLIRLNGYTGDLDAARQGLTSLEAVADGRDTHIAGLALPAGPPAPLRALARNNCLVETPKILWRRSMGPQLLASSSRLVRKWPRSLVTGPFHAAEAPWLACAQEAMRSGGLPGAAVLGRICALHLLAQSVTRPGEDTVRLAGDLFASRSGALAKPPGAAARDLACLGASLAAIGNVPDALTCLAQAHATARPADPGLANLIRRMWLEIAPEPSVIPAEISAGRPSSGDLRAAGELAAARFGPAAARDG